MKRSKIVFGALLLALALLGTACPGQGTDSGTPQASPKEEAGKPGGEIVFAAEQYPKCLNPVTSCYNASWMHYIATLPTLPQLLTLDASNNYVASPVVKEVPSLENKGLTLNPFTITYHLNPKAVWDDGTQITGADIKFTLDAYLKASQSIFGEDAKYKKVSAIDVTPDKENGDTVVIKMSEYASSWRDMFGGGGEYILKAAAFGGNPEISDKMQTDIGFSGAAFKLQSFNESELVLVRNENYWGKKALLDRIIVRKIAEMTAEVNAFKTGEIAAFFPQPSTELVEQVKAVPGGVLKVKAGTVFEGLWFNLDKFPLNDKAVRTALLYGLDRQAAIDTIVKPVDPKAAINTCLWNVPSNAGGKWCNKDFPTKPDKAKATKALEDGGWKKGADGIYEKGGQRLVLPLATNTGNTGREQFQTILQSQAKEIGIEIKPDNSDSTTLFQVRLPARDFTSFMAAQVATPDPSVTHALASDQIPSAESPDGQNYYGWKNTKADDFMKKSDLEADEEKRVELIKQLGKLMAEDIISVPLYPKPQILVYNSNKLGGDFEFNAGQLAFAHNFRTWYIKTP